MSMLRAELIAVVKPYQISEHKRGRKSGEAGSWVVVIPKEIAEKLELTKGMKLAVYWEPTHQEVSYRLASSKLVPSER